MLFCGTRIAFGCVVSFSSKSIKINRNENNDVLDWKSGSQIWPKKYLGSLIMIHQSSIGYNWDPQILWEHIALIGGIMGPNSFWLKQELVVAWGREMWDPYKSHTLMAHCFGLWPLGLLAFWTKDALRLPHTCLLFIGWIIDLPSINKLVPLK